MARPIHGTDLSSFRGGVPDLDPNFLPVDGAINAVENVARRWLTPNGTLPGDEEFGTDVRQWLQARGSSTTRAKIKLALEAEARKEERVRSCSVEVEQLTNGFRVTGLVTVEMGRQFKLVLGVSEFLASVRIET